MGKSPEAQGTQALEQRQADCSVQSTYPQGAHAEEAEREINQVSMSTVCQTDPAAR